jgi:hypothetical protein
MNQLIYGAIAGIIGGVTIAGVGMIYRTIIGGGFWSLPNGIGGIVLGPETGDTRRFGTATLAGVGLHTVLSAIYGVIVVAVAPFVGHRYVTVGIVFGIAVWLLNYYAIGAVHAGSRRLAQLNPTSVAFGLHALWGLVTGVLAAALIA